MIELKNVTKYFRTNDSKKYILKDVNLTIPSKTNLGILGINGAGKSTLLRMLGKIEFPNSGKILSSNTFSWPMGLAGGFQGTMTGRNNVKFVCRVYAKSDEEIKEIIAYVQDFAELGDYFDMPIKTYSSGMRGRLSFGLSLAFDFDYLIIDETLSVGDENFKKKANEALLAKIDRCNILLVSHAMATVKKLCQAGIVLDEGNIYYFENIDDAIEKYHEINRLKQPEKAQTVQSSAIYCSDGKAFNDVTEAAKFYKLRPKSIIQALNENKGSNVYLKKVFYRDGQIENPYQEWESCIENRTIISSDGVIFDDHQEATSFYKERFPNKEIERDHVEKIMLEDEKISKKLNVKFYYLSEYTNA